MKYALEEKRIELGLTYDGMAKAAGISNRAVVFNHCLKHRNISAESAVKYNKAFNIPLSVLRPDLWPPSQTIQEKGA